MSKLQQTTVTITLRGIALRHVLHCADGVQFCRESAKLYRRMAETYPDSAKLYNRLAADNDVAAEDWILTARKT